MSRQRVFVARCNLQNEIGSGNDGQRVMGALDGIPLLEQRMDSGDVKSQSTQRMCSRFIVVRICVVNMLL